MKMPGENLFSSGLFYAYRKAATAAPEGFAKQNSCNADFGCYNRTYYDDMR